MKKWWLVLFVVLIMIVLAIALGGNGGGLSTPTPTLTATFITVPISTITNTPSPAETLTSTPAQTSTITLTPTPTEMACFSLISPEDGSEFDSIGLINFAWSAQEETELYKLVIQQPNGYDQVFESENTSVERYLGSMPLGGEYSWLVTAFDINATEVCKSTEWGFSKAEFVPTETSTPTTRLDSGSCSSGVYSYTIYVYTTEPFNCCWGNLYDGCGEFMHPGSAVCLDGITQEWCDSQN